MQDIHKLREPSKQDMAVVLLKRCLYKDGLDTRSKTSLISEAIELLEMKETSTSPTIDVTPEMIRTDADSKILEQHHVRGEAEIDNGVVLHQHCVTGIEEDLY